MFKKWGIAPFPPGKSAIMITVIQDDFKQRTAVQTFFHGIANSRNDQNKHLY